MTTRITRLPLLPVTLFLGIASAGCAAQHPGSQPQASAAAPTRPAADEYPMIVRLVGRHYTVVASSGPTGVVYTAERADGRLVVANATLDELRRRHPEVYEQVVPVFATQGEGANTRRRDTADEARGNAAIPLGHAAQPASGRGTRGELLLMDADARR